MQKELTEQRIQEMEKELCVEQVKVNDKFNEVFQLLGFARRGLMQMEAETRTAIGSENANEALSMHNSDVRIVPRGLLERCLVTFQSCIPRIHMGDSLLKKIEIAIAQLKAALAVEKSVLSASNQENVFLSKKSLLENLKKWPQDLKMNTVTLPADIFRDTIQALEENI